MSKQKVLTLYEELQDIRKDLEMKKLELRGDLNRNGEVLLDILFDDTIPVRAREELVFDFPDGSTSIKKKDNPTLNSIFPIIWKRRHELTPEILETVEWYERAHQYDTNQS